MLFILQDGDFNPYTAEKHRMGQSFRYLFQVNIVEQ